MWSVIPPFTLRTAGVYLIDLIEPDQQIRVDFFQLAHQENAPLSLAPHRLLFVPPHRLALDKKQLRSWFRRI